MYYKYVIFLELHHYLQNTKMRVSKAQLLFAYKVVLLQRNTVNQIDIRRASHLIKDQNSKDCLLPQ